MAHDVLLAGSSALLAVQLAARHLVATDDRVTVLVRSDGGPDTAALRTAVEEAVRGLGGDPAVLVPERLCLPVLRPPLSAGVRYDVLWLLTGDVGAAPVSDARFDAALARDLLAALPELGVGAVNHVTAAELLAADRCGPLARRADALVARYHRETEREVASGCAENAVVHRLLRTVSPVGPTVLAGAAPAGVHRLTAALDSVLAEVTARAEWYPVEQPIRCLAAADDVLRPLPAATAARTLLDLARDPDTAGRRCLVASPVAVPVADLLPRIGDVYGVRLVPTDDADRLNPVDRLLHARLTGFAAASDPVGDQVDVLFASGRDRGGPEAVRFDPPAQRALVRGLRGAQRAAASSARRRGAELADRLATATAETAEGPLTYRYGGPEVDLPGALPVVLLGAVGQSLRFWYPLLQCLLPRRRVLVWRPRETAAGSPGDSAAAEIEAVLAHTGIDRCHLVGWCTGPKALTAFALRRPSAAASLVFLNGSFKIAGEDGELDTTYERNLEFLCRALEDRPESARRLMRLFDGEESVPESPAEVLTMTRGELREEVSAPFRTEAALTAYARCMLAFWADDVAGAGRVRAPVLAVGAENDRIVSTARLRAAVARFPEARYVELLGATHQFLYDRPELLARLMEEFWRAPDGEITLAGEIHQSMIREEIP